MKRQWITLLLCTIVFIYGMLPVYAVAAATATETMEEANVSANVPQSRLVVKEEEEVLAWRQNEISDALRGTLSGRVISALVYLCDFYELRQEPEADAAGLVDLPGGHTVFIQDIAIEANGTIWYRVNTYVDGQEYSGYVEREYLAYSDEVFIAWEKDVIAPEITVKIMEGAKVSRDIEQFPASYHAGLQAMKNNHPNWVFVKMNTGLDWNTVIQNEMGERSLVRSSSPENWKNGDYGSGWSYASEGILKYYMDPRNFLNETSIFQFEQLTYNASYHNESSVREMLSNTFMSGSIPGEGRTYGNAFWEIGDSLGVSPFHLACRVYQEQGTGTSALISGTYPGYIGLYNYFNIGASGNSDTAIITSGLSRARKEGWTTRYTSLYGGAKIISANYIMKGQDTLYLQKFDVDSSYNGLYWHQYMQNIMAPESEGKNIRKAYANSGSLENTFVFKIPVYNNMPAAGCAKPDEEPAKIPVDTEKVRAFVKRLYILVLGREADEKGLSYWTEELASGRKSGAEVAKGFIFSQEMAYRYLNDEQYVLTMYRAFFDRVPVNGDLGQAFWINLLQNGVSRAYVFRGFCHSDEFSKICDNYGITRGNITLTESRDQNHNVTMYVYRCYTHTLGRKPDAKGLNFWTDQILSKKRSPVDVAGNFIFSTEFKKKKLSDEEYVKILYRMFLDREYNAPGTDPNGIQFWLNELKSGNRNRYEIFLGFANSKEFGLVLNSFGL